MLRIGLTGPIAAGKSVVAGRLRELGLTVVDHDELARAVLDPGTPGQIEAVASFGPQILAPDGTTDRAALGRIVFADPAARTGLEAIIHPRVRAQAADLEAAAVDRGERLIVHDIPLLIETGQAGEFDQVLVVDAPALVRLQRLVAGRRMSEVEARQRMAAQATTEQRRAVADVLFDGSGSVSALRDQVTASVIGLKGLVKAT
jgi:dephospho-CoA kinase